MCINTTCKLFCSIKDSYALYSSNKFPRLSANQGELFLLCRIIKTQEIVHVSTQMKSTVVLYAVYPQTELQSTWMKM